VTTSADYTADEWQILKQTPMMVGMTVLLAAKHGPISTAKEATALAAVLTDLPQQQYGSNELIQALAAEPDVRQDPMAYDYTDSQTLRARTLEHCRQATALLAAKAGAQGAQEAEEYKRWLFAIGEQVARAAAEGGFLGVGATQVSPGEQDALHAIATALGIAS
jgi:hypothetical protein